MKKVLVSGMVFLFVFSAFQSAQSTNHKYYWIKIEAHDKFQRSVIANTGASIEIVKDDYVIAYGSEVNLAKIKSVARVIAASDIMAEQKFHMNTGFGTLDFPPSDSAFNNYSELTTELEKLATANPDLVHLTSLAKTNENRDIWALRITQNLNDADQKPAAIFMIF